MNEDLHELPGAHFPIVSDIVGAEMEEESRTRYKREESLRQSEVMVGGLKLEGVFIIAGFTRRICESNSIAKIICEEG